MSKLDSARKRQDEQFKKHKMTMKEKANNWKERIDGQKTKLKMEDRERYRTSNKFAGDVREALPLRLMEKEHNLTQVQLRSQMKTCLEKVNARERQDLLERQLQDESLQKSMDIEIKITDADVRRKTSIDKTIKKRTEHFDHVLSRKELTVAQE